MNFHYRLLAILALYIMSIFTGYYIIDDPKQNTSVIAILVLALMPIIIVMFCDALFHLVYSKYIFTVKTTAYSWNFNKVAFVIYVAGSSYIFYTQEMYVLMSLSVFNYVAAKCVKAQTRNHFIQ